MGLLGKKQNDTIFGFVMNFVFFSFLFFFLFLREGSTVFYFIRIDSFFFDFDFSLFLHVNFSKRKTCKGEIFFDFYPFGFLYFFFKGFSEHFFWKMHKIFSSSLHARKKSGNFQKQISVMMLFLACVEYSILVVMSNNFTLCLFTFSLFWNKCYS